MRTPLAIYNLIEGGWRTILSIVGIGIAVLLMFMQLGFLGAVRDTAVTVYNQLDFDIIAKSKDYFYFCDARSFPKSRLYDIASVDGVVSVEPFHANLGLWSHPNSNVQRGILIMGASPNGSAFVSQDINQRVSELRTDSAALIDTKSTKAFLGPKNRESFQEEHLGQQVELNSKRFRLQNLFTLGSGLAADGAVILNEDGFRRSMPGYGDAVTFGLIKIAHGTDPDLVKSRIESVINRADVAISTREEILAQETRHWIWQTPAGFIFMAGVVVAVIVGSIIIYIVLSSDVTRQLGEYATMKAMGYRNGQLANIVYQQAILLAICSYIGATILALILYQIVGSLANLPIQMTPLRLGIVLVACLAMCCGSATLAIQKLRRADPADLF